ncbi:hypothetical protein DVS77_23570 [Mycolicibacterium moriokaense]|nr:hypothetical protein DVS77_23570 [Mycolicibacterium moriokaense]
MNDRPPSETIVSAPPIRQNQTTTVLLWTGIVAGVVFIVAVVFFSGFFIGRVSSSDFGYRHFDGGGYPGMMSPRGGWPMGPGMMDPEDRWPFGREPSTTLAPPTPRP